MPLHFIILLKRVTVYHMKSVGPNEFYNIKLCGLVWTRWSDYLAQIFQMDLREYLVPFELVEKLREGKKGEGERGRWSR